MLRLTLVLLLLASPAFAQELPLDQRPFRVVERFRPGEVWLTATGLRTRIAPADRAPFEASIAWTQSVLVLERGQGFALQATLTSLSRERRDAGGSRVDVWREPEGDPDVAARTWTYEHEDDWTLRALTGAGPALDRLADEALRRLGLVPDRRAWARLRGPLTGRAASATEAAVLALYDGAGAPVRAVMADLHEAPVLPGSRWRFEPRSGWPGGHVGLLGVDPWGCARFGVTWQAAGPGRELDGAFLIDRAGRLVHVEVRDALTVGRGRLAARVTREVAHGVICVLGPARRSLEDAASRRD